MVEFDQVSLKSVSRHYGRRRALNDVSFTCPAGEVIALVGPNGAGKSTLLSILSTLVTPTSGEVRYGVHTARTAGASLRRCLGWLGHDLQLYPELTARENLTFFARLSGAVDADASVRRALELARLDPRADDPVGSFSRGMRQRLALERALIHDPQLVLLDEPFTGLDRASTDALAVRLRTLASQGRVIVLATHDVSLAEGVVDRAVVLRDGRMADVISGGAWRAALTPPTAGDH
jgi:heme ABC exporter ATP-binding subunit CcmA